MGGGGGFVQMGIGMLGNVYQAAGEQQEAQSAAAQARRNAILAEYAAQDATQRGATEAAEIRAKGSQTIASARVAQAASGIELDSPTAQNVISTTRAYTALDALTARSNAAREAWGYRMQAKQYGEQERQAKKKSMLSPLVAFAGHSGGL